MQIARVRGKPSANDAYRQAPSFTPLGHDGELCGPGLISQAPAIVPARLSVLPSVRTGRDKPASGSMGPG